MISAQRVARVVASCLLIMLVVGHGCARTAEDAEPEPKPAAESSGDDSTTTSESSVEPAAIPELATEPLDSEFTDWDALRANSTSLYGKRGAAPDFMVDRIDPDTGASLASHTGPIDAWTVVDDAVVLHDETARTITVLEPDTLAVRHVIALPPDFRAAFHADTPRNGEFWLAAHSYGEDIAKGIVTQISAARLDLVNGTVAEIRPLPPCGGNSVTEHSTPGVLVATISCAYQIVTIDMATGATTEVESFPAAAYLMRPDDTVWMRWKPFGYVARLVPGQTELETLDLNIDGPTITDLGGLVGERDSVWVSAHIGIEVGSRLLNRIDLDTFEVTGRAISNMGSPAFLDDAGYGIADARLVRFDPDSVTGGRPTRTVRPKPGAPPAVVPTTDDQRAAIEAFTKVFDPQVPNEGAAPHLGNAPDLLDIRTRIADFTNNLFPNIELVVSAISVKNNSASVSFSYLKDGKVAFIPFYGSLTRISGVWVVDRNAICQLASQVAVATC